MRPDAAIRAVTARPYTIPTDAPEADGTYAWRETTLVIATIEAGGQTGLGYTYSSSAAASLAAGPLAAALCGQDAFDIPLCHRLLVNQGPQYGPVRLGRDRDLRARRGALGSESETHGSAARGFARPGARDRSDLRQRRVHLLRAIESSGSSLPAGSSGTAVAR